MWRFAQDDFVKVFIWTIWGGMRRFAPDGVVEVLSGRCGVACGGFCVGRFRNVFILTIQVGMWRFVLDDFVNVFCSGRCGLACGGLLRRLA